MGKFTDIDAAMARAFPRRVCAWCGKELPLGEFRGRDQRVTNLCGECRRKNKSDRRGEG